MQSEVCGDSENGAEAACPHHTVIVGGLAARMCREDAGFAIHFVARDVPIFRARGLPSQVLALAEEHVRALGRAHRS